MNAQQLAACTGCRTPILSAAWLPFIGPAMSAYGITSINRMAAFLANVGHESGGLRYTTEIWGPTPAQTRYEGRQDLGNIKPGDGLRFRGHGLIQTTGRFNHARVRDRLRAQSAAHPFGLVPDFEADPDALALRPWAALSAADFWDDKGLNKWADAGDFDGVCDIINRGRKTAAEGDANGYAERKALYLVALKVLV